jgi:hypothetical protein
MTTKNIGFGAEQLRLKKFKITDMVEDCTIALIAKRATGKSFLTREILYQKRKIPSAVIISKTEKLNKFYGDFIPDVYIHNEFSPDILEKIYIRQLKLSEENENREKEDKKPKDDRVMLVMDDCMSDKKWVKEQTIQELFFNGRHYHISFILTMQYSMGIPPEMRSNFDYIFLLAEDFVSNKKRLYEHYAGMFPDFNTFRQVFDNVTSDYGVMVINNRIHSQDITEKVFWYKAKPVPNFKLGCNKYLKFHKKFYDPSWNKKLPIFDPGSILSKKRNSARINVKKVKR